MLVLLVHLSKRHLSLEKIIKFIYMQRWVFVLSDTFYDMSSPLLSLKNCSGRARTRMYLLTTAIERPFEVSASADRLVTILTIFKPQKITNDAFVKCILFFWLCFYIYLLL